MNSTPQRTDNSTHGTSNGTSSTRQNQLPSHHSHLQPRSIFRPTLITPNLTQSLTTIDLVSKPSILQQINGKLGQMVQTAIVANSTTPPAQTEGTFETRLPAMFQTLILTAPAEYSTHLVTKLCATAREFFKQKNAASVKAYLYHKLAIDKNLPIHLPPAYPPHPTQASSFGNASAAHPTSFFSGSSSVSQHAIGHSQHHRPVHQSLS